MDLERKKVLILGGSGFVGRHLARSLLASPDFLPVLGYHEHRPEPDIGITSIRVDVTDQIHVAEIMCEVDAVVNCTSGSKRTVVGGAIALATACSAMRKPPRLVHMSSMAVYGAHQGVVSEDQETNLSGNWYAKSKTLAERYLVASLGDQANLVVLRPGVIYGPGDHHWTSRLIGLVISEKLGNFEAAGRGAANLSFVDDVIQVILGSLRSVQRPMRIYNVAAPGYGSWNQVFSQIARVRGGALPKQVTEFALNTRAYIFAPMLLAIEKIQPCCGVGSNILSPSMLRLFRQNIRLDTSRLNRDMSIDWQDPTIGFRRTMEWFSKGH